MFSFRRDPGAEPSIGIAFSDRHGGFSTGPQGSLNLGVSDRDPRVLDNASALSSALGLAKLVVVHQVHGREVYRVTAERAGGWRPSHFVGDAIAGQSPLPVADAIVAQRDELGEQGPGLGIAVRVADCLPVVLVDERAQVMAVAHAGRVGLLGGVLPATVAAMRELGATGVSAWIGPHVCGPCYEVPQPMFDEATAVLPRLASQTLVGTPSLDLAAGADSQLAELGVGTRQVGGCTRTDANLHSYRAQGARSGRLVGVAWFGPYVAA